MLGDSQGSDVSINEWVAKSMSFKPLFMNNDQWQEEVVKAQLRRNEEWKELIYKAEHHPYLRGQIGVTLWLAGVIPPATPFVDLTEIPPIGLYQSYITKAYPLFEKLGNAASEEVKNFLMVRAMLAKVIICLGHQVIGKICITGPTIEIIHGRVYSELPLQVPMAQH